MRMRKGARDDRCRAAELLSESSGRALESPGMPSLRSCIQLIKTQGLQLLIAYAQSIIAFAFSGHLLIMVCGKSDPGRKWKLP